MSFLLLSLAPFALFGVTGIIIAVKHRDDYCLWSNIALTLAVSMLAASPLVLSSTINSRIGTVLIMAGGPLLILSTLAVGISGLTVRNLSREAGAKAFRAVLYVGLMLYLPILILYGLANMKLSGGAGL